MRAGGEAVEEEEIPWEGAIAFRRSAVQSRFECSTTLERLRFSSEKAEVDGVVDTPVQVTIDFRREDRDYLLDGVIRTSLATVCNRLLLPEAPVQEPDTAKLGCGTGLLGNNVNIWKAEAEDAALTVLDIDLDDKLHSPRDQKEMDLSKYWRDTVHLEIPTKSLCDSACLGLCFGCGVDLNASVCICVKHKTKPSAVDMLGSKNRKKDICSSLELLKKQPEEQQNSQS